MAPALMVSWIGEFLQMKERRSSKVKRNPLSSFLHSLLLLSFYILSTFLLLFCLPLLLPLLPFLSFPFVSFPSFLPVENEPTSSRCDSWIPWSPWIKTRACHHLFPCQSVVEYHSWLKRKQTKKGGFFLFLSILELKFELKIELNEVKIELNLN